MGRLLYQDLLAIYLVFSLEALCLSAVNPNWLHASNAKMPKLKVAFLKQRYMELLADGRYVSREEETLLWNSYLESMVLILLQNSY